MLAADEHRQTRAAVEAVVAFEFGLSRPEFRQLLSGFSDRSCADLKAGCLTSFEQLEADGLDAFVQSRDPYADVPVVTSLPEPAMDNVSELASEFARTLVAERPRRGRPKKASKP
jgi:hypothetical protein